MPAYIIEWRVCLSEFKFVCACTRAHEQPCTCSVRFFFSFNGMRVLETDVQTAALSHISPSCMYSSEPGERLNEQVNNHI